MRRESDTRVIITGALSGIGEALAKRYAAQGATLGLIARREGALKRLAAQLISPARIYPVDVRDAAGLAPFLMSADAAAGKIISLIERRKTFAAIPWPMAVFARVLHLTPNRLYDRLFGDAPHKPRRGDRR